VTVVSARQDDNVASGPLAGVRVVELGGGVACAFAGRWLAALGADVVRVEPRAGDPAWRERILSDRGATPFRRLYLDAGKRAIAADLASAHARRRLDELLAAADLVLDGTSWCPGSWQPAPLLPAGRAVVRVTPFGDTGPYVGIPFTPLTLAALSGLLWHVGDADRPPLAQWGDQVEHLAGLHAFAAALAALWADRGLEVAAFEVAAALVGHHTSRHSQVPLDLPRQPARALWRLYATADGWAGISCTPRDRARVAEVMGLPEIAAAQPFMTRNERDEAILVPLLETWFRQRTGAEVEAIGRSESVPLAAVRSVRAVAAAPQLAHREFFVRLAHAGADAVAPGHLWRSGVHGWRCAPAPSRGAEGPQADPLWEARPPRQRARIGSSEELPLAGVRVVDLGQVWAGPYAAMLLADQGADVIKVESPSRWDPNRCVVPPGGGREQGWWNTGAYFQEYNRNKRSLALEIAHPRGRDVLAAIVRRADIVIENYRAGVLDRLGIGYDWLRAQREDVILVSMAAFGQTGPDHARPGYGPVMEELSGLASLTGWGDGRPQLAIGYAYGDPVAATAAAAAALAALHQRRRSGRGQHVDLAQFDVLVAMIGEAFVEWSVTGSEPLQQGNRRSGCAPHGVYACAGIDEWVAIAVETDAQWLGLRRVMRDPAWARDPALATAAGRCAREAELDERVSTWTRAQRKTDVFERCVAEGVPAAPVHRTNEELLENAQLRARGFYERVKHATGGAWSMHGWEWRPPGAGPCVRRLAPDFGSDNEAILRELAGLSSAEIAALAAEGVIGSTPIGVPRLPGSRA
jgi:crotonobetainyl-CoA:carnitine CoA-transferase CaiB-like acyl-CoA transferase